MKYRESKLPFNTVGSERKMRTMEVTGEQHSNGRLLSWKRFRPVYDEGIGREDPHFLPSLLSFDLRTRFKHLGKPSPAPDEFPVQQEI